LNVGFTLSQFDIGFEITGDRGELFICGKRNFCTLSFPQDILRFFLIVPEIGIRGAFFQSLQACAILRNVKDSSARV
jgi:hypothetical protein